MFRIVFKSINFLLLLLELNTEVQINLSIKAFIKLLVQSFMLFPHIKCHSVGNKAPSIGTTHYVVSTYSEKKNHSGFLAWNVSRMKLLILMVNVKWSLK